MNALLYSLVVVIWGTTWIAIYLQQGPVAAPVSIFWRFAVASAVMIAILLASGKLRRLSGRDHLFCLLQGGCVFCFNFWCFYTAAAWINTGLESVIFSMAVLFNAINSFVFFGQKPPRRFYLAAGLGLTGIVTLFWQDLMNSGLNHSLLLGIGLSALGTYGFSLGNMISLRHQKKGLQVLTTNSWAMLYGTLLIAVIAAMRGDSFTPQWTFSYLSALLYLAIFGSVIAFGAYFTLVGRIGPSKAAYSTLLFPLVALTLSTLYEGYVWQANAVAGLALILLGNLVMFARPEIWMGKLFYRSRGRRIKNAPSKDWMVHPSLLFVDVKHGGVCRHVINHFLQRFERHRRTFIAQVFTFALTDNLNHRLVGCGIYEFTLEIEVGIHGAVPRRHLCSGNKQRNRNHFIELQPFFTGRHTGNRAAEDQTTWPRGRHQRLTLSDGGLHLGIGIVQQFIKHLLTYLGSWFRDRVIGNRVINNIVVFGFIKAGVNPA